MIAEGGKYPRPGKAYKPPRGNKLRPGMAGCVFCGIARGSEGAWRIYSDERIVAFLDKYPASYGHVLVSPKDHYEDVVRAPPQLVSRAFALARALGMASIKYLGATGFRVLTNAGASAGQIIFHFHVHVIPRYGRGDPGPVEPRSEISGEVASAAVEAYKKALEDPEIVEMLEGRR